MSESQRGRKHSKITRQKMSATHKERPGRFTKGNSGQFHSEETRRKISEALKGLSPSKATKNRMSLAAKGHSVSREIREKISEGLRGENNASWKGGISRWPYPFDFDSKLKEIIRERDGYACQNPGCGRTANLHVHHVNYIKSNISNRNLITLCGSCHSKTNHNRENWFQFYFSIMEGMYESVGKLPHAN